MKVTIKLKEAYQFDILEIDSINSKGTKKWKLKLGMPYWMKNSKGKIENKNYIITEATNAKTLGDYLSRKQIFIPK